MRSSNDGETAVTRTRRTRPARPLVLAAALLACGAAPAQDAATLGLQTLAASCAACHGTNGKAQAEGAMPRIAGLEAGYFAEQMRAFRDGKRPATVMHQIAKGYSDAQIDALAAYFAAQPR